MAKDSAAPQVKSIGSQSAPLIHLVAFAVLSAVIGAVIAFVLAEGLPEGAFVGALLGGSIGIIIAMRRASGAAGPAFEYEAAGIHDDNLITTARRNLVREAYRDSFGGPVFDEKIERSGSADRTERGARRES